MRRPETRVSQPRWRTLGSMALAIATVAVIGFSAIAPAKADDDDFRGGWRGRERHEAWRDRDRREEWREHRPSAGIYFYSPQPYGYYYEHR